MKRFLGSVCYSVGALGGASIIIAAFLAYFVRRLDRRLQEGVDGLGRRLVDTPWVARLIFNEDGTWAGWGWFIGDMAIFWGGLGLCFLLFAFGSNLRDSTARIAPSGTSNEPLVPTAASDRRMNDPAAAVGFAMLPYAGGEFGREAREILPAGGRIRAE